jgi:protein transport protein SEC31
MSWGCAVNPKPSLPMGLIAGGLMDGSIQLWDPAGLQAGRDTAAYLASVEHHRAPLRAMQFNPHASAQHLLAAASTDGDISVVNLDSPSAASIAS